MHVIHNLQGREIQSWKHAKLQCVLVCAWLVLLFFWIYRAVLACLCIQDFLFYLQSTIGKMLQRMPESREKVIFELKVLFLFLFYYLPLIVSVLAYWAVSRRNLPSFTSALLNYFVCESSGISPGKKCDRSGFETVSNPYFYASGVIIVAVIPAVNLVSVVNFNHVISRCKTWYKKWLIIFVLVVSLSDFVILISSCNCFSLLFDCCKQTHNRPVLTGQLHVSSWSTYTCNLHFCGCIYIP